MKVLKTIKKHKDLSLVKTEKDFGGEYAVITFSKAKTGLNLDAANDLYKTLKKLCY